ncbi:MAG: ABC transporter ATP-binding protein [Bacteroidetes bacterium MedPE-SWsnd-G2]|nr:MAG: ABC transporter ATP-binding protein [Bacteroidetes bacterium MedPE-SWsnd-G2]
MLIVDQLQFQYNDSPLLDNISFQVKPGEHVSIIGESGCGKSTLLKLLYGTYDLHNGHISWKNEPILGPKFNLIIGPSFMKYVAQEFDLMPFITVSENIGKYLSNFYMDEKRARIKELLEVVQLEEFANTMVKTLSGGQKQRVALAQAIAKQPEIILLDEPFSHIDNFKKQHLRRSLFSYLKQKKISCIVATHDKQDVLAYSDQLIVLDNGKIIDSGTPKFLYKNPNSKLVASFFGEFNTFYNNEFGNDRTYIYAHELSVNFNSEFKGIVTNNHYMGNYYLVEMLYDNRKIYIESHTPLEKEVEVGFSLLTALQ